MRARVEVGGADWEVELDRPASLAIETGFAGEGPNAFGAPRASAHPLVVRGFNGSVAAGASCNCSTVTITPHCNGTHTECAGHLTAQPLDAIRVVPLGLVPAVLLTVTPERAGTERTGSESTESERTESERTGPEPAGAERASGPFAAPEDRVITPRLLEAAWPRAGRWIGSVRALVVRTRPNDEAKRRRDYTGAAAPYLTADAARWVVERHIEHLIVDLPSVDRTADEGRLTAHRIFFGLPPGVADLARAARAHCTITELAYVPDSVADGEYLLQLQVPALAGDAVPSRPLLYAAELVEGGGRPRAGDTARESGTKPAGEARRELGRRDRVGR